MKTKSVKLELTPLRWQKVIDSVTSDSYVNDRVNEILSSNRKLFNPKDEILVDGFYYAFNEFVEDGKPFVTLTPYRIKHSVMKKKKYSFGCYNRVSNELNLFFKGMAKSDSREHAVVVYNSLLDYCKSINPNLKPFAIKL